MRGTRNSFRLNLTDHMSPIAFGLAIFYLLIEAFMEFITWGQADLVKLLLGSTAIETQTRLIVLCLLAIFGSHAQFTINSRKQAEEALKKSEERYRTLVQNVPIGIVRISAGLEGQILMANPAFVEMMGIPSENDLKYVRLKDLFSDPTDGRIFSERLEEESSISWMETRLKRRDHSEFWALISARTASTETSGASRHFDCTIKDISAAKKAEEEEATRRRFQKLLSPDLAEMVVSGKLSVEKGGNDRVATIMFADIRSFTAMSEKMTATDVLKMLNEYYEEVVDIVFLHEGTVDKFIGDEIMVIWGAPVTHDDDPIRAVRAALDIQSMLSAFNKLRAGEAPIQVGIGINTGPLVAGYIGSSRTMSYSVIGDTVNTTSRICSAAGPGQIIISEKTHEYVKDHFEIEELEPILAKGKSDPLRAFEVLEDREFATVHLYFN